VPNAYRTCCGQFADGSFDTVVDKGALDALMGEAGAEGAAHVAVGIELAVKGADHDVEGVVQVIGLPTGELALGDGDFLRHDDSALLLVSRCSI
jgi:hypothetical protein